MPSLSFTPIPGRSGVGAIVEEVLSSVLAPGRRDEVLREALELASLDEVPDRPTSLRVFIEGALFATLAQKFEVSDALELVNQLRASLGPAFNTSRAEERTTSDIRSRLGVVTTAPNHVLVLTQASLVVFLLQDVLGDAVDVLPIDDRVTLRDRLRRYGGQPLLVVIDRKHPCEGPGVCDLLKAELSAESTVVWGGAGGEEIDDVQRRLEGGPRLVPCAFDLALADLGELCRATMRG